MALCCYNTLVMNTPSTITPNIRPKHAEQPLSTGRRLLANMLVLSPLSAFASILFVNLCRQYSLGIEFLWWVLPLAAEIVIDMLSITWPIYLALWVLSCMGDFFAKRRVAHLRVWLPIYLLFLAGGWLLLTSIPTECVQGSGPWAILTHLLYMCGVSVGLFFLQRRNKCLIPRAMVLKAVVISLIICNSVVFLWACKDGTMALRASGKAVGTGSNWASMHNPLLK